MRSETIFRALRKSEYVLRNWHRYCDMRWSPPIGFDYGDRKREQCEVFERELFRRLDEHDTMRADIDRLQRDLAEALASESHAAKLHSNVSTELLRMDAQLAEARAEVERLRPAAEKWIADEEARNRARAARGKG